MNAHLTLAEVAALLRLTPEATYRLVRSGELPALKMPGHGWFVQTTELAAYLRRPPTVPGQSP